MGQDLYQVLLQAILGAATKLQNMVAKSMSSRVKSGSSTFNSCVTLNTLPKVSEPEFPNL